MNKAISTKNVSIWFESQNKSFTDLAQIQIGKMKNINNVSTNIFFFLIFFVDQLIKKKIIMREEWLKKEFLRPLAK